MNQDEKYQVAGCWIFWLPVILFILACLIGAVIGGKG